jgi:hypothetical protein
VANNLSPKDISVSFKVSINPLIEVNAIPKLVIPLIEAENAEPRV